MARGDKYDGMSDHDLLIEVVVKQDGFEKQFSNHLHHHWAITIAALSAAFMGAVSLFVSIIMILIKAGIGQGSGT